MALKSLKKTFSTRSVRKQLQDQYSRLSYGLYTLWLFTESDTPTFVLPNTLFGLFGAMSQQVIASWSMQSKLLAIGSLPQVLLFNWSNLLIFDLANQRLPESVLEDKINKPWRPIPAGRLDTAQANKITFISAPLVILVNALLGTERETLALFALTWWYNDLRGGDGLSRNVIIAIAFAFYNLGSLRLSMATDATVTEHGYGWILLISGVILTTMQMQDLKDQKGDATRNRRTLPLVMGDRCSRWLLAIFIFTWSCTCAFYWDIGLIFAVPLIALGCFVSCRTLVLRDSKSDARSWRLWCLWTAVLYTCPLLSEMGSEKYWVR